MERRRVLRGPRRTERGYRSPPALGATWGVDWPQENIPKMLAEEAASAHAETERKSMADPQAAEAPDLQTLAQNSSDTTAAGSTA